MPWALLKEKKREIGGGGGHLLGTFFFYKSQPLRQTGTLKHQPVCTPIIDSTAIVKYLTRLFINGMASCLMSHRQGVD